MSALFGSGFFRGVVSDELEAAFNSGKVFRSFYELDLASNDIQVFKFEVSGDVVLESSAIDIDDGGISYKVYAGGTDSGTFTPLPISPQTLQAALHQ